MHRNHCDKMSYILLFIKFCQRCIFKYEHVSISFILLKPWYALSALPQHLEIQYLRHNTSMMSHLTMMVNTESSGTSTRHISPSRFTCKLRAMWDLEFHPTEI